MNINGQEVCDTCGGNCGQCGTSIGMGIAPNMDFLIRNLHGESRPVVVKKKRNMAWAWILLYFSSFAVGLLINLAMSK